MGNHGGSGQRFPASAPLQEDLTELGEASVCILCGQLIADIDWTERRFDSSHVESGVGERTRRQARARRAKIVRMVLGHYGLEFHDDWSATTYVVANKKGASELARNIGEVWPKAELLTGRLLDPLDPELVAALEGRTGG